MNIVIIQDYLRCGGTETQSIALANFLSKKQAHVTVLTARPGGVLRQDIAEGVRAQTLQPFDTRVNFWFPRLGRQLEQLQPDVVLLMGRMANCLGRRIKARLPSVKLIATMRSGQRLPKGNVNSFEVADEIVVNSQWAAQILSDIGVKNEKVTVINNALSKSFDLDHYDSQRADMRMELGASDSTLVMLNVASFCQGKGQPQLLRAISHLKLNRNWQLWLVGEGPELDRCRRLVQGSACEKQIFFLGYQSQPFPYYAGADLLILTSQRESQPNVLIEAQSIGLPVVAHDVAGAKECFVDGESGYLVPFNDASALVSKIEMIGSNHKLLEQMKQPAKAWADEQFHPQKNNEAYWRLFQPRILS